MLWPRSGHPIKVRYVYSCAAAGRLEFSGEPDGEGKSSCAGEEAACVGGFAVRCAGKLSVLWDCGVGAEQVDLGALDTFRVRQKFSTATLEEQLSLGIRIGMVLGRDKHFPRTGRVRWSW